MRDPTTDVAEPRPFHVPLIDTLGPVRCGVATVMSSSLRVPPHYQRRLEIHRLTDLTDIARYFSLKLFARTLHQESGQALVTEISGCVFYLVIVVSNNVQSTFFEFVISNLHFTFDLEFSFDNDKLQKR